mmetsp:Transcript_30087/g.77615  ORF Transcript_30087/g.77615 Transcript_30087/m.77615 type:complete len:168 (-) Transcript_30087:633-1136(-)
MSKISPLSRISVVLVHPQIAQNTGNAGRSCLNFSADLHLIRPIGFDISDKAVKRAGANYLRELQMTVWDSWEHFHEKSPSLFDEMVLFTTKSSVDFREYKFQPPPSRLALLFGSETSGVKHVPEEDLKDMAKVAVPNFCPDHIRCLNLATTVGVGLYEAIRQRGLHS